MIALDVFRDVRDILTATAAIVAGIKAWCADKKSKRIEKSVTEIKNTLAQQQAQKQTQNITVNVGTTAGASAGSTGPITFSEPEEEAQ